MCVKKKLDLTKPVQTKSGLPVRILCTDREDSDYKIVGLIMEDCGEESLDVWTIDGRVDSVYTDWDLINVTEEVVRWVNVYLNTYGEYFIGDLHATEEEAKKVAKRAKHSVTTICVKFTV